MLFLSPTIIKLQSDDGILVKGKFPAGLGIAYSYSCAKAVLFKEAELTTKTTKIIQYRVHFN